LDNQDEVTTLKCGHRYHKECHTEYGKGDCPLCLSGGRRRNQSGGAPDCELCGDNLDNQDEVTTLKCGHRYHKECHTEYGKGDCPLCLSGGRRRNENQLGGRRRSENQYDQSTFSETSSDTSIDY
jgi:hypothetical protein